MRAPGPESPRSSTSARWGRLENVNNIPGLTYTPPPCICICGKAPWPHHWRQGGRRVPTPWLQPNLRLPPCAMLLRFVQLRRAAAAARITCGATPCTSAAVPLPRPLSTQVLGLRCRGRAGLYCRKRTWSPSPKARGRATPTSRRRLSPTPSRAWVFACCACMLCVRWRRGDVARSGGQDANNTRQSSAVL